MPKTSFNWVEVEVVLIYFYQFDKNHVWQVEEW